MAAIEVASNVPDLAETPKDQTDQMGITPRDPTDEEEITRDMGK